MIAFWCFTSIGALMSLQYKYQREEDGPKLSMRDRERLLDEQNRRLDMEISELLSEYRTKIEQG